jgi:hypothetical protein
MEVEMKTTRFCSLFLFGVVAVLMLVLRAAQRPARRRRQR